MSCSPEDPIGSFLLAENIDVFVPFWVEIVNLSQTTSRMDCLKSAVLIPRLKDLNSVVDIEHYKNFQPVSNLMFVSKLIERCVAIRLEKHMHENNLHSPNQFGYKKGHSTEMLLLHLNDTFLSAFDNKCATVLLLLDLSAAFDTVDQNKLLCML